MVTQRLLGGVQRSMNTSAMTAATSSPSRLNPASSSGSLPQHSLPMARYQTLWATTDGWWLGPGRREEGGFLFLVLR